MQPCRSEAAQCAAQVQLHPKSVWEVPGSWRDAAQPWDGYGDGRGVLAGIAARDDLLDRVRFFAEECDAMQACVKGSEFTRWSKSVWTADHMFSMAIHLQQILVL